MKKPDSIKEEKTEKFVFAFHRAGFGEIRQFMKEAYPDKEYSPVSYSKAVELGLVDKNAAMPKVYKAFFVENGRVEQNPYVLVNTDPDFVKKFRKWYEGPEREAWLEAEEKRIMEELESYYED